MLELTAYFGERDRSGGRLLADELMDAFARHGVLSSALLRGMEGFGFKHTLQTERLLTLSEDLPMVAVAVDSPARIHPLAEDVHGLASHGLITLERALRLGSADVELPSLAGASELKLTVQVGRQERAAGRPAHLAVVDCLHRHGVEGASVLLGLDGAARGIRRRARFMAGNGQVPMIIVSVGDPAALAGALDELRALLADPVVSLERVRVCKRDGVLLARPDETPPVDSAGLAYWQKLVLYASERSRGGGEPLHSALIRRLRREGAPGATALRGVWGYHGEHPPHGERFFSLARHAPVLTVLLDTPANIGRWFDIVDELTGETGLVTSELVPALRAGAPATVYGGLRLAAAQPARRIAGSEEAAHYAESQDKPQRRSSE